MRTPIGGRLVWGLVLLLVIASSPLLAVAQDATPTPGATTAKGVVSDVTGIDLSGIVAEPSDCAFIQIAGQPLVTAELGEVRCGILSVPENWAYPGKRTVTISYAVLVSLSPHPAPDPLVYLEGGPGGSALGGISMFASAFAEQRKTRDIVLFDQRGSTFSSPLVCSAFTIDDIQPISATPAADGMAATPEPGPVSLVPSTDTQAMMNDARVQVGDSTARCVRELLASGADLRQYNSIASANDTVALVHALGYETYNIYGISYGTRLALVLMRDHPEGIRSVVLDSTFPPEMRGFELYPKEAEEVVLQVFADCRIDPACNAAYPDLREHFISVIARLQQAPLETANGYTVTATDLIEIMRNIAFTTQVAPYIPRMITELDQGITTTYDVVIGSILFEDAGVPVEVQDNGTPAATPEMPAATPDAEIAQVTDDAADAASMPIIDLIPHAGEDGQMLTPAEQFIDNVQVRLGHLDDAHLQLAISLLMMLDKMPHTAETLEGFVALVFEGPANQRDRVALLSDIANLSPDDIEAIFQIPAGQLDMIDIVTFGMSNTAFNTVTCNEEIPFESFQAVVDAAASLEMPALGYGIPEQIAQQFAICEQWPSGRAPDIENKPVVSDIPTLILAGEYDFQTPLSWNKEAFVHLANASFIEFPSTGHGVIVASDCAKTVAEQFLARPYLVPDARCTDALWPAWVLPGDPLPQPVPVDPGTPAATPST